jgi:hypothetical protein
MNRKLNFGFIIVFLELVQLGGVGISSAATLDGELGKKPSG